MYARYSKGVNIKHSKLDKRRSENIFRQRIQEVFIGEFKKFKNWEKEVLKQGKRSSSTQIISSKRCIQDVLKV